MIFISYRREDTGDSAHALADKLIECFGSDAVFIDRQRLLTGDDWQKDIERALSKTAVVLVLIGRRWLTTFDEFGRRRIDRNDDSIAYELSEALRHQLHIIPLYLHGVTPLPAEAFPSPLAVMASVQGFRFDLAEDFPRLVEQLGQIPGLRREPQSGGPKGEGADWRVFISAKSVDYPLAKRVFEFLTARGIHVFLSDESLPKLGNADYRKEIDHALDQTQHMIVVTSSKEHVESSWVEAEWGFFINEKRSGRKQGNLVTVLAGGLLPNQLPPSLRYYEALNLDDNGLRKLVDYVRS